MKIVKLLDEINLLCDTPENRRRMSLWGTEHSPVRGETQWHGIPKGSALTGEKMPVTAECLNALWKELLGLRFDRYYNEPEYFLEHYLQIKILKFHEFPDDTPIDRTIPLHYGIAFEAGILGQEMFFSADEEPWLGTKPVVTEESELRFSDIHFVGNGMIQKAIRFYREVKRIVGEEFTVQFPQWFRGPQGVALYLRGFENFLTDIYLNPELVQRTLRYVTEAQKAFIRWRSDFLEEPIQKCDLFNDDVPIISPEKYGEVIVPFENELSDYCGGVYYWHSCGDITRHIPEIERVRGIELLDLGVSMEDKGAGIAQTPKCMPLEVRILAQKHIQEAGDDDITRYMKDIVDALNEHGIERYVLRSSGMSVLLGAEEDLAKLRRWVEITRTVCGH